MYESAAVWERPDANDSAGGGQELHMRAFRNVFLATVFAAGTAMGMTSSVLGAPPTDEQIDALITKVQDAGKSSTDRAESMRAMKAAAEEGIATISLEEATIAQLQKLSRAGLFTRLPETKKVIAPRLAELAEAKDADGARAAMLCVVNYPDAAERTPEARREQQVGIAAAYKKAVMHPAVGELLESETEGGDVFRRLGFIDDEVAREAKLIEAVEPLLSKKLSPATAASTVGFFDTVSEDDKIDAAVKERIRTKTVKAVETAIAASPKSEDGTESSLVKYLNRSLAYLDGPFAKGQLMDNPAPAITFNWSTDEKIKSLADLKGRVVVVDFWATWCGPCIGSFPNVRELQKRYEGYPVTILGVTSIQGSHSNPKTRERTDTKGDPAKEKELMVGFVKDMEVTWPVAFSDQEVFNPAYGVRGIPHVAIIDPAGKVRHNGLHPGGKLADKAAKIDALLKEAGLPCPEPIVEEEKPVGQ
jgi:thiol-disulfide isomerase/thioredoxin